jgi:hypothetical protein
VTFPDFVVVDGCGLSMEEDGSKSRVMDRSTSSSDRDGSIGVHRVQRDC